MIKKDYLLLILKKRYRKNIKTLSSSIWYSFNFFKKKKIYNFNRRTQLAPHKTFHLLIKVKIRRRMKERNCTRIREGERKKEREKEALEMQSWRMHRLLNIAEMWIFPGLLNFPRPLERHARENSTKRGQRLVSSCLCTAHCLRNIYHRCIIQRGRIFAFEQSSIQSNFNEIEQPEFLQKCRRLWFFLLIDWIDNSGIASSILSHFVISHLFVY